MVPGLGAFMTVRHSAVRENSGRWIPMHVEYRFNASVCHDDGLLAGSYARRNKTDYNSARELMRADIDALRNRMLENETVPVGSVGRLEMVEGRIIFTPLASNPAVQGWQSVTETREAPATAVAAHSDALPVDSVERRQLRQFNTAKNYYIAVNKTFAKTAAVFVLVFAVAIAMWIPSDSVIVHDKASVVPLERIGKGKTDNAGDGQIVETSRNESDAVENANDRKIPVPQEQEGPYHLIVATFRTSAEAEQYVSMHKDSDFPLHIVSTPTKRRVAAQSGPDRDELLQVMASAPFKREFPQSWIWED